MGFFAAIFDGHLSTVSFMYDISFGKYIGAFETRVFVFSFLSVDDSDWGVV